MNGTFWDSYSSLVSAIARMRSVLRESGQGVPGSPAVPHVDELLADGGMLLRPSFVIFASPRGRCEEQRLCRLAAAVGLVHDDIIDAAEARPRHSSVPPLPVLHALGSPARTEIERLLVANNVDTGSVSRILQESALCFVDRLPEASERTLLADAVGRLTERAL